MISGLGKGKRVPQLRAVFASLGGVSRAGTADVMFRTRQKFTLDLTIRCVTVTLTITDLSVCGISERDCPAEAEAMTT